MNSQPKTLEIRLVDQRVGWLIQRDGRCGIRFNQSWRDRPDRRVFSLSVEDKALADVRATPHLPTWFENVLFEGEMRRWILTSEPEIGGDDLSFLARIGEDLVGAVTLHSVEDDLPLSAPAEITPAPRSAPAGGVRWSLAGVQLKLNLAPRGERFTMPVQGETGQSIAIFADQRYRGVPINEHATMTWARAAGIEAAETCLIDVHRIDDLPAEMRRIHEPALLVKRFDRRGAERVHAEEFAQIFGIRPREKTDRLGWRHQLRVLAAVAPEDTGEYLRRLLFVIASGNADAHHKNWSILYPDGRRPRLAPADDQVSTVTWTGEDDALADNLAYKLAGSRRWEDVRLSSILHRVDQVGLTELRDGGSSLDRTEIETWIRDQVARIQDALAGPLEEAPPGYRARIEAHWARTPLFRR